MFHGKLGHKQEVFCTDNIGMRVPLAAVQNKCLVEYPAVESLDHPSCSDDGLPIFYCHSYYDTIHETLRKL